MSKQDEMKWKRLAALNYRKKGKSIRWIMNKMGYKSISAIQNLIYK